MQTKSELLKELDQLEADISAIKKKWAAGFSARYLWAAGVSMRYLWAAGANVRNLWAAGVSTRALRKMVEALPE